MSRDRRGFSLIEILIAVAVLAIGILSVLGSMTYGTRTVELGIHTSEGLRYAREVIDLIRVRNLAFTGSLSGLDGVRTPLDAPPFQFDLPPDTGFSRSIRLEKLARTDGRETDALMKVSVTVYWADAVERSTQLEAYCRRL